MTWIHDQIYAAGGEHLPNHWSSFVEQTGVDSILHLQAGTPAKFLGPIPASFLWMNLELEAEVGLEERWLAAVFINLHVENGRIILIHSSHPLHRVRWTYVAYQIFKGRSVQASLKEVEQKPWLAPYHTDRENWDRFKQLVDFRRGEIPAS